MPAHLGEQMAATHRRITAEFPDRFLLGIGTSRCATTWPICAAWAGSTPTSPTAAATN
jgi:hypothetical protein